MQPLLLSSGKEQTELFHVVLQSDQDFSKGSSTDIQNRLHTVRAKQGRFHLAQSGKSEFGFQEQNVLICLYDCKKSAFAEARQVTKTFCGKERESLKNTCPNVSFTVKS